MRTILIGIGNPVLTDDSVGIKIAQHLEALVDTEILMTTDFKVLDKILGYERAIIVDGVRLGNQPGTIMELDFQDLPLTHTFSGTHNLSLSATLNMGYRLFGEEMPKEIRIVAVEVEDVETFGTECTPQVKAAIPCAVELVRRFVQNR